MRIDFNNTDYGDRLRSIAKHFLLYYVPLFESGWPSVLILKLLYACFCFGFFFEVIEVAFKLVLYKF